MKRFPMLLLLVMLSLSGCGSVFNVISDPQPTAGVQASGAQPLDDAAIQATVAASIKATQEASAAVPTAAPAPTSVAAEVDVEATIAAAVQAAQAAQAASGAAATSAPAAAGGASETLPTSTVVETLPTAVPVASVPQTPPQPAMLLVLDSSGSMLVDAGNGQNKIDVAKGALNSLVDALPEGAPVGLRVYGHRYPNTDKANGCRDSELISPVAPLDKAAMKQRISSFQAVGYTPIAFSLQEGFKDLPPEGARTMVLVSDGEETCDQDPCAVAAQLKQQGVDLVVETVGFQVDDVTRAQLQCIAEKTGGQYRDAQNADELAARLQEISQRALREYQAVGGEIVGGSDFRTALALQPGEYVEKIRVREIAYYKVQIGEGQKLSWAVTTVPPSQLDVGNPTVTLTIFDRMRREIQNELVTFDLFNNGNKPETVVLEFDPAAPQFGDPLAPGEYYITLGLDSINGGDQIDDYDFTSEMLLDIR